MPDFFEHTLNSKARYGVDWDALGWLPAGAQITSSTWTPTPSANITISGQAISAESTETSALVEVTDTGTYTITNHITANDGSYGDWEVILEVPDATTVYGYMTLRDAATRLFTRWGLRDAELAGGDLLAASQELDSLAPFIGVKYDTTGEQELAFPRSIEPDGTEGDGQVPERVLNWVALAAYTLSSNPNVTPPAISSESIGSTSRTYATPKLSQISSRMASQEGLIDPYLLKVGQRVGAYDTWRTYESYPDWPLA